MQGEKFHSQFGVAAQLAEAEPEIKVVTPDGDILDIKEVKFSGLNGGEIHIVAQDYDDE